MFDRIKKFFTEKGGNYNLTLNDVLRIINKTNTRHYEILVRAEDGKRYKITIEEVKVTEETKTNV